MPSKWTGILVVGVLLAASGLAFLRAEQLKLERSPVADTHLEKEFSTICPILAGSRCTSHSALLRFRLRDAGTVALTVVDGAGRSVKRLTPAAGVHMRKGPQRARWDGHTQAGATAADGIYHLRVHLISLGRTITIPDPITLDDTPPTLTVTSAPGALPVRYAASEPAAVFAHARELSGSSARGAVFRGRGGKVRLHHSPLAGAEVGMTLVAVDRAGNTSVPVSAGTIRLPG